MQFDAVLLAPRRAQMRSQGWWRDTTINDVLDQAAQQWPDRLALVGSARARALRNPSTTRS